MKKCYFVVTKQVADVIGMEQDELESILVKDPNVRQYSNENKI